MSTKLRSVLPYLLLTALLVMGFSRTRAGDPIYSYFLATPGFRWEEIGTITAVQAVPAAGARTYTAMWTTLPDANTIEWDVPEEASGIELRFLTTADGNVHTVDVWVAAGPYLRDGTTADSFEYGAQLALTGGTQTGPNTNVYVDTITATNYVLQYLTVSDSGNNHIAIVRVDLRGYKKLLMTASVFQASTTLRCHARYY